VFPATGEINPVLAEQIFRGGLSALRDDAHDAEFLETLTELQQHSAGKGAERYAHGVLSFSAATVRYVQDRRFMCVYDTALPHKPHHVDIMAAAEPSGSTRGEKEWARRALIKEFIDKVGNAFVSAAEFRAGILLPYARPGVPAPPSNGTTILH
jgi:hypothetical protein